MSDTYTKLLKPCPFCGGSAKHKLMETYSLDSSYYVISCSQCPCVMYADDYLSERNVMEWNTREPKNECWENIDQAYKSIVIYNQALVRSHQNMEKLLREREAKELAAWSADRNYVLEEAAKAAETAQIAGSLMRPGIAKAIRALKTTAREE